jgi:hypothetical protein
MEKRRERRLERNNTPEPDDKFKEAERAADALRAMLLRVLAQVAAEHERRAAEARAWL